MAPRFLPWALFAAALGGVCSLAWALYAGLPLVWRQAQIFNWWLSLPTIGLTLLSISLRLFRWQFLLRQLGVRLPIRQSARYFLAGLAMVLTPAYLGEGLKVWLVARAAPSSGYRALAVVVGERLLDGIALALLGAAGFTFGGDLASAGVLAAGAGALIAVLAAFSFGGSRALLETIGVPGSAATDVRLRLRGLRGWLIASFLSWTSWVAGSATLAVISAGAGVSLGIAGAVASYAYATLLGGLTLLPAGVGVVGTAVLLRMEQYGAATQQAILIAALVRLFTVWLSAGLGIVACWRLGRRAFAPGSAATLDVDGRAHFDALAPCYSDQLSAAARERVVTQKVSLMRHHLAEAGLDSSARILDAGCGHGWYAAALAAEGFQVTGVDIAVGQIREARQGLATEGANVALTAGSVLDLPFTDAAFDAAYAVNVLHHVGDRPEHTSALAELARVVRPGGLVFLHEISTVNPLFRLYMCYVFPLWKRIDLGTEHWLHPEQLPQHSSLHLRQLHRYTFLPDFTPRPMYRWLRSLERRLERTQLASYAAHFTAVYVRQPQQSLNERQAGPYVDAA